MNSESNPWDLNHEKLVNLCKSCDPVNTKFYKYVKTATGAVVVHCGQKSASFPCAGKKDYNCDATLCGNCNGITNEYPGFVDKHKLCHDCLPLYRTSHPEFAKLDDTKNAGTASNVSSKDIGRKIPGSRPSASSSSSSGRTDGIAISVRSDAHELNDEHHELKIRELDQKTIEAETWLKEKCVADNKLDLSDLWSMPLCGGSRIFGTDKCMQIHWYVAHYIQSKALEDYDENPEVRKDNRHKYSTGILTSFIDRYCCCASASDEVHRKITAKTNLSLLNEYMPSVLKFNPYSKGDSLLSSEKARKILDVHESSSGNQSFLRYYKKVKFDNFLKHITDFMSKFGRAISSGSWNHRSGYIDDTNFMTNCVSLWKASGDKIDSDFTSLKNRICSTIQSKDILGLEYAKFNSNDLKLAKIYFPEYVQGVADDASEEQLNLSFKKIYDVLMDKRANKLTKKIDGKTRIDDSDFPPKKRSSIAQGGAKATATLSNILGLETPTNGNNISMSNSSDKGDSIYGVPVGTSSAMSADNGNNAKDKVMESLMEANICKSLESSLSSFQMLANMTGRTDVTMTQADLEFLQGTKESLKDKIKKFSK